MDTTTDPKAPTPTREDELRRAILAAREALLTLPWPISLRPALDALENVVALIPQALADEYERGHWAGLTEGREQAESERCSLDRGR